MIGVAKGLVVIQSSVMDVNLGNTRNVVVLKVDLKLFPSIYLKDIRGFANRWMIDLKSI